MHFCHNILEFFKHSSCVCRQRKNDSESGLNCGPEFEGPRQDLVRTSCLFVPRGQDTRLTTELASNDQTILSQEDDLQALILAIEKNNSEVLASKVLNTDLSTFIDSEGFSLLHKAVFAGNLQAVSILASKVNLDLTDDSGRTALHYACLQQRTEIVDYLIESGCKLDISDNYNKSPIDYFQDLTMLKSFSDIGSRKTPNSLFSIIESTDETNIGTIFNRRKRNEQYLIKDYEVIRFIGQGSFSKVFLVRNLENHEFFAMKVMNKERICQKGMLGYVLTEKKILSKLKHPFIVPLVASFQINSHLMLLLRYCPDSLQDKIKNKLAKCVVKLYTCELALVIGYLHENCIIYRDLKPGNVLINDDGHIMLADFGLAKESLTADSFCGSIGYLAPEMEPGQIYGKEVDWYMLGLIIFEMTTGFGYCEQPEKLVDIDQDVKNLIEKLLEKDPKTRLGALRDLEEVKENPYFQGVNWEKVAKKEVNFLLTKKTADFKNSEKMMSLSFVDE